MTTWTTEQGLPQEFVSAIRQTPDGFFWIGTYGGLARFDGLHFRTFVRDAPPALRGRINSLEVDGEGLLWIGTASGLFVYRNHVFHSVLEGGQPLQSVLQLVPRQRGGVWLRTAAGLFSANREEARAYPLPSQHVQDIAEDGKGRLWAVVPDRVLLLQEGGSHDAGIVTAYPLPNVKLVYTAPDGRILAGDWHTLFLLTDGRFVAQPHRGYHTFIQMLLDRENRLWLASGGPEGVVRLDHERVERLDKETGLTTNDARVLFEDRDGDMWIGTVAGLQRLHHGTFTSFSEQDGLRSRHEQYDAVFEDAAGSIWIGSSTDGVAEWKNDRWKVYGGSEGVSQGQVRGFAAGAQKPVLALGGSGIYAWKGGAADGRFQRLANTPAEYITSPLRGKDGSLWFSVPKKGVYRRRGDTLTLYGNGEGLTDDTVWCLTMDAKGDLWAGSATGVFRFQNERWSRVKMSRSVFGILWASDGGMYLATAAGLIYDRNGAGWTLTQQEGLPTDTVFGLAEDSRGDLWMTTAGGICRIPHGQIEALNQGKPAQVTPEIFTTADGLRSHGVLPLGQETMLRARDGRLWFATTFAPAVAEPIPREDPPPQALLDEVVVDDRHLAPMETTVDPGRHRITFGFTAPSFVAPEQIRFRYRLRGWEDKWIEGGTTREASYAGLSPGRYFFEVQALGRTGVPGPISSAILLQLKPYFWQTRLFLFATLLAAFALVVEITRRRTRAHTERLNLSFQERASERERIALQIHDTFVQDLVGTALQLELLGLQLDEDPVIARDALRQLNGRLRGIITRSRDIVSNLHSMAATHEDLVELLRHIESEFRLTDLPLYAVLAEGAAYSLPPFVRDEIYRICREAVANVFRHANAGSVTVTVRFDVGRLTVAVVDDGVGMTSEMQTHGRAGHFGLSGMQTHAERIGATLEVRSIAGEGTIVLLTLDLYKTRLRRWIYRLRGALFRDRAYTASGDHPHDEN